MKDLEVVSRPMPSWRVQQTFVPMRAASRSFLALSRRVPHTSLLCSCGAILVFLTLHPPSRHSADCCPLLAT